LQNVDVQPTNQRLKGVSISRFIVSA